MNKMMNILKWVFRCLVIIIAFLFVLGELVLPEEITDEVYCEQFDVPWKLIRSDGSTINDIRIPGDYAVDRNEKAIVETVLPEDIEENLYLCFRSNRQDIEICVDGKLRQKYSTLQSRPYGHSSAGAFVFLKIKRGDAGKTLRVTYQSDTGYSGKLRVIYYGDKMGIWRTLLKERGSELVLAVMMLIMGVFSVVGSIILRFGYKKPLALEYLGWGVTLAACWMLSDSIFRQLFFSNVSVVNDLAFVMVMLLPFPFLIYMNEVQKRRYNVFYVVACSLVALDSIVCIALQFLNILDFADSIAVFAGFCGVAVLLIIITMIVDCFKGNIGQYKLIAIGILGAAVAAVLQLAVYFARIAAYSGFMIAVGMIFLLVVSTINTIQDILLIEKEKQQAIFANESKARFLANMSHEIRTPINAVLGMDEMILQESTEQNVIEYAKDIRNAGKTLLSLINDILDFSKIESGKMDIVPVEYDISSLIFDCYNVVAMKAKDKGLTFTVENDIKLPCRLYGDEVRVRQVLVNLLTNAVKYTKEGSIVMSVQGQRLENGRLLLQLSVQDTGIGITEENLTKLFDSFQRVDEKKNRNIEGTGLGLTITMQLVELMQGSIKVESEYGKGSVFHVEFPQDIVDDSPVGKLSAKMDSGVQEAVQEKEELIASEGKILVVDDVDMNLKVFCGLLRHTQLQIDTASSGKEALEKISHKKYHIIFLDHMMPEMDGLETFRAMKQMDMKYNADTPVIMLTANAIAGVREQYLQEGFTDYLSKPVQINHLKDMIRKYLPTTYVQDVQAQDVQIQDVQIQDVQDTNNSAKDETDAIVNEVSVSDKLKKLDFLDTKTGLTYCMNSEEFYIEILQTYLENDKTQLLKECFMKEDWQQYEVHMHSIKSTSLSIGANRLSEHAKEIEISVKEGRLDFAQKEHDSLLKEYKEILQKIEEVLEGSC